MNIILFIIVFFLLFFLNYNKSIDYFNNLDLSYLKQSGSGRFEEKDSQDAFMGLLGENVNNIISTKLTSQSVITGNISPTLISQNEKQCNNRLFVKIDGATEGLTCDEMYKKYNWCPSIIKKYIDNTDIENNQTFKGKSKEFICSGCTRIDVDDCLENLDRNSVCTTHAQMTQDQTT